MNLLPMKIFVNKKKIWIFGQEGTLKVLNVSDGSMFSEHHISKYPISNVAGSFHNIWIFTGYNQKKALIIYCRDELVFGFRLLELKKIF